MYTLISKLTTKSDATYSNVEEWIEEHGPCGIQNPLVEEGSLELDDTDSSSVIRTLTYTEYDLRQQHENDDVKTYVAETISEAGL